MPNFTALGVKKNEGHFRLDYLPPYSPYLNPIERVWKLTRKLCIHEQYFPSIAAVITAVETQFDKWTSGKCHTLGTFVPSNYFAFVYVPVYICHFDLPLSRKRLFQFFSDRDAIPRTIVNRDPRAQHKRW